MDGLFALLLNWPLTFALEAVSYSLALPLAVLARVLSALLHLEPSHFSLTSTPIIEDSAAGKEAIDCNDSSTSLASPSTSTSSRGSSTPSSAPISQSSGELSQWPLLSHHRRHSSLSSTLIPVIEDEEELYEAPYPVKKSRQPFQITARDFHSFETSFEEFDDEDDDFNWQGSSTSSAQPSDSDYTTQVTATSSDIGGPFSRRSASAPSSLKFIHTSPASSSLYPRSTSPQRAVFRPSPLSSVIFPYKASSNSDSDSDSSDTQSALRPAARHRRTLSLPASASLTPPPPAMGRRSSYGDVGGANQASAGRSSGVSRRFETRWPARNGDMSFWSGTTIGDGTRRAVLERGRGEVR